MNHVANQKFGIGAPVRRKEDKAFITGGGRYVADVTPEGTLHAVVLRSPMAHATFTLGDLDAARSAPGVHLVLVGADVADLGPMPCAAMPTQPDGSKPEVPDFPVLCRDRVRFVGDAIAFVVADTLNEAKSAAELIDIDFEPLDAIADTGRALDDGVPLVWEDHGTNHAFETIVGDPGKVEAAFEKADRVVRIELINNRVVTNYMEPRGAVAEIDTETGNLKLTVASQGVHSMHRLISEKILKIDPDTLRVVTHDVGGGFGTKMFVYREYPLVLHAARLLGRPVKWVADRTDHFLGDSHGRDNVTTAEVALDKDGRFLGLKVDIIANMGAYFAQFGPYIPWLGATMMTGVYDIPAARTHIRGVFTNTVPLDAYRGAGRPESAFLLERLVDKCARETGIAQDEIRRRNFIAPGAFPYATPGGRTYDVGEFAGHLDKALEVSDWAGFEDRLADSRARGLYRGIGLATYIEACAFAGSEGAEVRLEEDGSLSILIGTMSNGQGHATAYGQIAAGYFGVDLDRVNLVQGDTAKLKSGGGTGGSRSIPLGLPSVDIASRTLVEQLKEIAADRLEASTEDLELTDGEVRVVGTDKAVSLVELAQTVGDKEKLSASGKFKQDEATYPNGSHVCEVEIDPETGVTRIVRYTIVDDFGVTVNPILLAGQVHGGVVQAAGQALMEHAVYDEDGQLMTASFLDYTMPRADDMPDIGFQTRNVPSTTNMLGIKGAGEAGTIGATPGVMNAVVDALHRAKGIVHIDMPATPLRVWEAVRAASASAD
ncbi:carbon-monoxide dehydrogenase large subunit [Rhodobium orientis]|uniref:Carbon monoxide dehydrogenase n=1 Tax=Rhodobium orientis TaxID=34017 RepID=A0A327JET4_9HYPH|nr:xanthine dehydrogenase family protein molybdopterin-binding subunit [Rhodobium orientis]MBB4303091.1 carbon-monoxide dehydrogenase large subunit [Rhodobium orientis]MBK5948278.1 carbon monoxide dehydrogenase [Rhodobium orientis]RAI24910.1 carbon monoxide dehydrogenase [Rhodobium orientis]